LRAIAGDARPKFVLTTSDIIQMKDAIVELAPELRGTDWIATDVIVEEPARELETKPSASSIALLQYTSGSTSTPKGVVVTHANIIDNQDFMQRNMKLDANSVMVTWLPLFHDMGLIGALLCPVWSSFPCVMMSPLTFLMNPYRWVEAVSRYRGTISGAPNFAFELCARKTTPEQRANLDLSSWTAAYCGAEPIQAGTLDRFADAFAVSRFARSSLTPLFGLAEATLMVSGGVRAESPVVKRFDAGALSQGRVVPVSEGPAKSLVGCGRERDALPLAIVDPETHVRAAPDRVGEIWISGGSVTAGYFGREEATAETFGARLAGGDGPFLRTGDLGFVFEGELFIAGRIKDLVIISGRNIYPQDIEHTAQRAHPAVRAGGVAVFGIEVSGEERLVALAELDALDDKEKIAAADQAIRLAVFQEQEQSLHDLVLLPPGSIVKTSSGKVERHTCRKLYLEGRLSTSRG
jgi:acyl-CoA synthetase (AMP-forming)/AMP-acid ligase II